MLAMIGSNNIILSGRRQAVLVMVLILHSTLFILDAVSQRITVKAPTSVAVGQQFQLQYVVNTTDVKNFRLGNVPDAFSLIYGPSTSTQQSFSMVNGRTTQSSSVTYTYVLTANKNGAYSIPPAHAVVAGSNVSSQAYRITVSGHASQGGGQYGNNRQGQHVQQAGSRISGNDLFIRVTANKQRVYEQEPILLTYKVYTQVELTQLEGKMPDLSGFHTQEIPLPQQKSFHIENVGGKAYRCVTWSQYVMFPQMAGKLEIPSITFKGIVVQENPNVDPFEAFFNGGSGYVEVKKEIKAPGLTIQVDALPAKPAGFSGGVGRMSVSATTDKKTVKAGDPVNLRITVSGVGNMKLIKQPEIVLPKDFDKYEPKITDNTKISTEGLTGSMIYDMLIVPRNKGEYTIPAMSFIYYDTQSRTYKTSTTQPIKLTVEQGNGGGNVSANNSVNDNDVSDIITDTGHKEKPNDILFGSMRYVLMNVIIVAIFAVLLFLFRKRAKAMADGDAMRMKKARRMAVKRLRKADKLMKEGKKGEFYDEVLRALWGYAGDKLNMPVEQLSRDNVAEKLNEQGKEQIAIDSFIEAIDDCEYARYAPVSSDMDLMQKMQLTYKKATEAMLYFMFACMMFIPLSVSAADYARANADAAYRSGDYQKAVELYKEDLREGVSAVTYHNMGNAYYRMDNVPMAILCYERALKFSPSDSRIEHSLQIAQKKTADRLPSVSMLFFKKWYMAVVCMKTANGWAYCAVVMLVAALMLLLLYLFASGDMVRRVAFYLSAVAFLFCVACNVFAWQHSRLLTESDTAVVIRETVDVKSSPAEKQSAVFTIHEGTSVEIQDADIVGWLFIRLSDGREGWIKKEDAEMV